METIYTVLPQQWAFEKVTGRQMSQPTEEDFISGLGKNGEPTQMINPEWQPDVQDVELETVIIIDRGGENVFKFVLGTGLPEFLAHYVEFLDTDGRQKLRTALEETSGIVVPTIDAAKLSLVPDDK